MNIDIMALLKELNLFIQDQDNPNPPDHILINVEEAKFFRKLIVDAWK